MYILPPSIVEQARLAFRNTQLSREENGDHIFYDANPLKFVGQLLPFEQSDEFQHRGSRYRLSTSRNLSSNTHRSLSNDSARRERRIGLTTGSIEG
jgi:hypothetical protein